MSNSKNSNNNPFLNGKTLEKIEKPKNRANEKQEDQKKSNINLILFNWL